MITRRILITGSREWPYTASYQAPIRQLLRAHGPGIVVHGGARGVDLLAGAIAAEFNWPVEAHMAEWNAHKWRAGYLRNQALVDLGADVCLAFPLAGSRGTYDCMKRARIAGIPVIMYPVLL